jgi:hypothetical protein
MSRSEVDKSSIITSNTIVTSSTTRHYHATIGPTLTRSQRDFYELAEAAGLPLPPDVAVYVLAVEYFCAVFTGLLTSYWNAALTRRRCRKLLVRY